ncbi:hypothetical protein ACSBR2_009690 [Camellia fascicularis]
MGANEGGWKPVFRRRQGRQGPLAKLHTIFVDEIPESMNPKGLFTMFSNFGVVKDVYIPEKRRKATRTRFVRYDCPVAPGIAIQKANGVWCGDRTLKLKKADFERDKEPTHLRVVVQKPVRVMRSNGDVIKLRTHCSFDDFKTECQIRGLKDTQLREGSGRNAFITFNSKEDLKQLMNSSGDWIMEWCESIIEWNKGVRLDNDRVVWVSCFGVPPNLWNVNNF